MSPQFIKVYSKDEVSKQNSEGKTRVGQTPQREEEINQIEESSRTNTRKNVDISH